MTQTLRLALCATVIAAVGCGGGDDGGPPDDGGFHACGNGTCEGAETCRSCREDCGTCEGCGNGTCDVTAVELVMGTGQENCRTCPEDCGCGAGATCGELNSNRDAACFAGCDGNGTCDAAAGETCANCAECACAADQTCENETCVVAPRCGDGTCTRSVDSTVDENCASCAQDCGCTGDQVCRSWEALGLTGSCGSPGSPPDDPTLYCGSACGSSNPIIGTIPGTWDDQFRDTAPVSVDIVRTACNIPGHEAGDACVHGFSYPNDLVLAGARLFISYAEDNHAEGVVLEEGRRIEFDYTSPDQGTIHQVWIRRP